MRKIIGGLAAVCLVGNLSLFQPEIKEVRRIQQKIHLFLSQIQMNIKQRKSL